MHIDTHAHLFRRDFGDELHDVIQRAVDAGIDRIIVPGTNPETSREAVELADKYGLIYACVGIHPHEAAKATDSLLSEIESLSASPKVVAIGEIGLDYHYDFSPRERQKATMKDQVLLAVRKDLPIVIHTRESLEDTLEVVDSCIEEHPQWKGVAGTARGVFHCFSGTADDAGRVFARNFLVSYPGIVTFKNSPVVMTLKSIGVEHILLETDSPYMAPVPLRGRRNEPAYLVHIAEKVCEILGISETELAQTTTRTAANLFGLDKPSAGDIRENHDHQKLDF